MPYEPHVPAPFDEEAGDQEEIVPRGLGADARRLPVEEQVAILRLVRIMWRWHNHHEEVHQNHDEWARNQAATLMGLEADIYGRHTGDPGRFSLVSRLSEIEHRLAGQSRQNWAILLAMLALIASLVAVLVARG